MWLLDVMVPPRRIVVRDHLALGRASPTRVLAGSRPPPTRPRHRGQPGGAARRAGNRAPRARRPDRRPDRPSASRPRPRTIRSRTSRTRCRGAERAGVWGRRLGARHSKGHAGLEDDLVVITELSQDGIADAGEGEVAGPDPQIVEYLVGHAREHVEGAAFDLPEPPYLDLEAIVREAPAQGAGQAGLGVRDQEPRGVVEDDDLDHLEQRLEAVPERIAAAPPFHRAEQRKEGRPAD